MQLIGGIEMAAGVLVAFGPVSAATRLLRGSSASLSICC